MRFLSLLLFFFVFSCAFTQTAPKWDKNYNVTVLITIPSQDEYYPIQVYYDETNKREKFKYYDGLATDLSLYGLDEPTDYEIRVAQTKKICFINSDYVKTESNQDPSFLKDSLQDETKSLIKILPDLKNWDYVGIQVRRGLQCDVWESSHSLNTEASQLSNVYQFFVKKDTEIPVQLHVRGYKEMLVDHYDEYFLDYYLYTANGAQESDFEIPIICDSTINNNNLDHNFDLHKRKLLKFLPNNNYLIHDDFHEYLLKYKKSYSTYSELLKKQSVYFENLNYIQEFNKKNTHMKLAVNHLTDLTNEEYQSQYLQPDAFYDRPLKKEEAKENGIYLPTSQDWRGIGAIPSVKDQSTCKSSWAFSVIGAIESQHFLGHGVMKEFSKQMVLDCTWEMNPSYLSNFGCEKGDKTNAFKALMQLGGIMLEEDYPYLGIDGYCGFDSKKIQASIFSYQNITTEDDVMQALFNYGALSVDIDASQDSFRFYSSGIYSDPNCSSTKLNHSLLLAGYSEIHGNKYWILRNSWSENWGENGDIYITRGDNDCGVATNANSVIIHRL
ncbi:hypothetical protein M0813_13094 [Anaeramoeba flamelloides]|uniref:Uncharacterized protein n=1 Tax=Anaeramoeba flamelloides TaxID=1746091 RepID=A0ABQ8ZAG7_9EUKA|nr:hypothetical protein M0813_13094 [Anaeramoeba flamelloides]